MLKNKRGDATDILLFLVIIFFVALGMVVALFANSVIKDAIDDSPLTNSTAYSEIDDAWTTMNEYTTQRGFTLFFGILIIGIIISSFLIRVHPVFIFIYIFILGISILTSVYLANAYAAVVASGQLAAISENYQMMTFVMQNVTKILLGVGALSMIIIFAKLRGNGPGGDI